MGCVLGTGRGIVPSDALDSPLIKPTQLTLAISARNLPDFGESAELGEKHAILSIECAGSNSGWKLCGRQEEIVTGNHLNFDKIQITTPFLFQEKIEVKLTIEYFLVKTSNKNMVLPEHFYQSVTVQNLAQIAMQQNFTEEIHFSAPYQTHYGAQLKITAEEVDLSREFHMKLSLCLLQQGNNFFHTSKFCLCVSKQTANGKYEIIHTTKNISETLSWNVVIPCGLLNDENQLMKVECYNDSIFGSKTFIGEAFVSLNQLITAPHHWQIPCHNQKILNTTKLVGEFLFEDCKEKDAHTFLEYARNDSKISFVVAVDFTDSSPTNHEHIIPPILQIMQNYPTETHFGIVPLNASPPGTSKDFPVIDKFHVQLDSNIPSCSKLSEVIDGYRLSNPALPLYDHDHSQFAPSIRHAVSIAQEHQDGSHYVVLFILTDGKIGDMSDAEVAIAEAANFPVSIVIVGTGNGDFDLVKKLSADFKVPVSRKTKYNTVQFFAYNNFQQMNGGPSTNPTTVGSELAREALRDIPLHFMNYMERRGFSPISQHIR